MITREMIEARIQKLTAERDELLAKLQAYTGALQDNEYWLEQIDKE
jgi:Tfp pilus assembly protein PilN